MDDWDDDNADELDREWKQRHEKHSNAGIREGVDEGKTQTVQSGFNVGYKLGIDAGLELGLTQGIIASLTAVGSLGEEEGKKVHMIEEGVKLHEKGMTLRACHGAAAQTPGPECAIPGTADRLASSQTGLERWLALAASIQVDLANELAGESLMSAQAALRELGFCTTAAKSAHVN